MTDYTLELELEQRQDTTDNLAVHSGNEEAMLSHGGEGEAFLHPVFLHHLCS